MPSIGVMLWTLLFARGIVGLQPQEPAPFPVGSNASEGAATVEGVVTRGGTGEPIPLAVVQLARVRSINDIDIEAITSLEAQGPPPYGTTDAGGRFVIQDVVPGSYQITAYRNGFVRQRHGQDDPGRSVSPVELRAGATFEASIEMTPAAVIADRVVDEIGDAVPRAQVAAVQSRVGTDGQETLQAVRRATTDDRGQYRLFWLDPGEYTLTAAFLPNPGLYTKRILLDAEEIAPHGGITIEPGFDGPMSVLISPNGGRIEGVVSTMDGERMDNAMVTLLPMDMPDTMVSTSLFAVSNVVRTDANGNYSFSGIAPGEYRLFAWGTTETVPFRDPEFIRRFATRGERVVIRESDALSLSLEVITADEIQ